MKEVIACLFFFIVVILILYHRVGCWVQGGVMVDGFLYPRCIKADQIPAVFPWEKNDEKERANSKETD